MAWVEPDVHAWSARMREALIKEMPELVAQSVKAEERYPQLSNEILARYPQCAPVVHKIAGRRGMRDNDLCGVCPLGLLVVAWECADRQALEMMLHDIGQTCLQGDTFRLFSLILAMHRSRQ